MRIAFNRETKCRIQGSPYFWSRPPASPLLLIWKSFRLRMPETCSATRGAGNNRAFEVVVLIRYTNHALLINVDFLLSNVQISVFNLFLDFEILCKTSIWPGRGQCQNPGRTTRQAPFPLFQFVINQASFRPLFLSTSDRDLFTFTKGVKNYNSSVLLLLFRGGIRPARRHPRWCA